MLVISVCFDSSGSVSSLLQVKMCFEYLMVFLKKTDVLCLSQLYPSVINIKIFNQSYNTITFSEKKTFEVCPFKTVLW